MRRKLARRIGLWLFRLILVLLLVVGTALVAVFSLEQYSLRPLTEYLVEKATGRSFSIDGGLELQAGRVIDIRAGGIRLANADWGSGDNLLSIDNAEVSIDLLHLLEGMPPVDRLEASGIRLVFEQDEQGRSNWAMGSGSARTETAEEGRGAIVLPVAHSRFSDVEISVRKAAGSQTYRLHLDSIGHSAAADNQLRVTAAGEFEKRPLNLQARIGPLTRLLDEGAVDFDLEAGIENIALEASGDLDRVIAPRKVNARISMKTPEIAQIFELLDLPEIVKGASELNASLVPVDDHHQFDLSASIDALKVDAKGRLQALDTIDGSSVSVNAAGPDLAAAARLAGLKGLPAQPFKFESSAALSGGQLTLGESRFDSGDNHLTASGSMGQFPELAGTDLQLKLNGKNYLDFAGLLGIKQLAGLKAEPFEIRSSLQYIARDRQQFTAGLELADLSGDISGKLSGDPAFVGAQLDYRFDGRNDGLVERILGRPTGVDGTYTLQGSLQRTLTGFRIERAALSFGANQLEVSGTLGENPLHADTGLTMHFAGPDLDKIAAIAGYTGFLPAGDTEIDAAVQARDNTLHVDDLAARLGRNSLKASGLVSLPDALAGSRVKVALSGEKIADVLPPDLLAYVDPQQSFDLNGSLATRDGRLAIDALQARLGEVNLKTSGTVSATKPLTDTSLKLDAQGPDLAAIIPAQLVPYPIPAAKFSVNGGAALTAGGLVLDNIKARIGDDRLGVSGTIPLQNPTEGLSLAINAAGPNLRKTVPVEMGQFEIAERPYEIAGKIRLAKGILSLHQLDFAASRGKLTGQLRIAIDDPRRFGEFDLRANGKDLREFSPSMPQYTPASVPFDLEARGSWGGKKLNIEQANLQLGGASIEAQGEVDLPPGMTATRLEFSARGDNLSELGQFGKLVMPTQEFGIDVALRGDGNGLEIPRLDARVGKSDLHGSLRMEFADRPKIVIELQSEKINLAKLLPPTDSPAENETPAKPPPNDGRLIPQLAVPADQLNRVDLETHIRMAELDLPRSILRNIEIDTRLRDGELTVTRLQARATEGQLIASFRAVVDGDRIVTSGQLQGKDVVFGKGQASEEGPVMPKQDIDLEFDTAGATVRELAANLNGYLQIKGGKGRMRNSYLLDLFGSFFSELLNKVNPFVTREPYTSISCFAAFAEITDGVAEINPGAVLQTDKLNVFASGNIDLGTEEINLRFDTSPRTGIGISLADFVNPFVGVSGTLADPGLGVDPDNAMFEGGFAFATGGLSIVARSLFERWFADDNPCAELEKEARDYLKSRDLKQKPVDDQPKPAVDDQ
ncbi:MAG: AsmA-like C-terminal region-containing protein [Gammaproteobacteria bacterium]